MKIALQFAMPSELHALPGARELAPLETVSGVPIFEIAPDILACAGENLCSHFFTTSLCGKLAGIQGFHKVRTMVRFAVDGGTFKDLEVIELADR